MIIGISVQISLYLTVMTNISWIFYVLFHCTLQVQAGFNSYLILRANRPNLSRAENRRNFLKKLMIITEHFKIPFKEHLQKGHLW